MVLALLGSRSPVELFLRPVGLSFGMPLANNPLRPTGAPLLTFKLPLAVFEPLLSLVLTGGEFVASPLTLPLIAGALLSTVVVFFKAFPARMDWRS